MTKYEDPTAIFCSLNGDNGIFEYYVFPVVELLQKECEGRVHAENTTYTADTDEKTQMTHRNKQTFIKGKMGVPPWNGQPD